MLNAVKGDPASAPTVTGSGFVLFLRPKKKVSLSPASTNKSNQLTTQICSGHRLQNYQTGEATLSASKTGITEGTSCLLHRYSILKYNTSMSVFSLFVFLLSVFFFLSSFLVPVWLFPVPYWPFGVQFLVIFLSRFW